MRLRQHAAMAAVALAVALPAHADVISTWNATATAIGGPQNQRTWAMVHAAMFDAVNAIDGGFAPYQPGLPAPPPGASAIAAAAGAGHGMLVRLFPGRAADLAVALGASLVEVPDGPSESDGVAFGDLVAARLFAARLDDHILAPGPIYTSTFEPGDYRLTPGAPPQPVNTGAPTWRPFALTSASQFRPSGPPPVNSAKYAQDVEETRQYGASVGSLRTPEQDLIARWAIEQAHSQMNRIARVATTSDGGTLVEHARLFALLNLATADAVMAVFDAKYTYRFWRLRPSRTIPR